MKVAATALALLVLIFAAGVVANDLQQNYCLQKNPFLKELQNAEPFKVTIFEQPVKMISNQFCTTEWNLFGFCCDPHELKAASLLEEDLIEANMNSFLDALQEIFKVTKSSKIDFGEKNQKQSKSKVTPLIESLSDFEDYSKFTTFAKASNRCWGYMNKLRRSALCSICSGRSQAFFAKDKLLITPDTCRSAIDNCEEFFFSMSSIVKRMPQIIASFKAENAPAEQVAKMAELQEKLTQYDPPEALLQAFVDYNLRKADKPGPGFHSARVCSMIVNLRQKPYILLLDPAQIEAIADASEDEVLRKFNEQVRAGERHYDNHVKRHTAERDKSLLAENLRHKRILVALGARYPATNANLAANKRLAEQKEKARHEAAVAVIKRSFQKQIAMIDQWAKEAKVKAQQLKQEQLDEINKKKQENLDNWGNQNKDKNNKKKLKTVPKSTPKVKAQVPVHKSAIPKKQAPAAAPPARATPQQQTAKPAPKPQPAPRPAVKVQGAKSRKLQAGLAHSNFFKSDCSVLVTDQDSMFSSFIGAPGTTLSSELSEAQPMNATLIFA